MGLPKPILPKSTKTAPREPQWSHKRKFLCTMVQTLGYSRKEAELVWIGCLNNKNILREVKAGVLGLYVSKPLLLGIKHMKDSGFDVKLYGPNMVLNFAPAVPPCPRIEEVD